MEPTPQPPTLPAAPPVDPSQPAAGGWVPTPGQRAMAVGAVSSLTMLGGGLATSFPGSKVALFAGLTCGALAIGIATALGMNSAGPRKGV